MTTTLPFAVYGTLRSGMGNDRLWIGHATSVNVAAVYGYRLVTHGAFPYAIPAPPDQRVVVEVIQPHPGRHDALLDRLDALEGYPFHYDRFTVDAHPLRSAPLSCWMYVPVDAEAYDDLTPVPGNDWTRFDRLAAWTR